MEVIGAINHYLVQCMQIAIVLFACIEIIQFIAFRKRKQFNSYLFSYIFCTYMIAVFILTDAFGFVLSGGFPEYFMKPNFIPIVDTIKSLQGNFEGEVTQIFLNMILFVPFGFLLPLAFGNAKWNWKRITVVTLFVVCVIEFMEYLSGRYMDIDDLIVNTLGSVIGHIVYLQVSRVKEFIAKLLGKKWSIKHSSN